MSKRSKRIKRPAPAIIVVAWLGTLVSIGLLFFTGTVAISDIGSLRSCNANNGLIMTNCGKQSLNPGDIMIFFLFVLSAVLVVTLFTHAWRITKGNNE